MPKSPNRFAHQAAMAMALTAAWNCSGAEHVATVLVRPKELREKVLHNPGMGWVLYENYPLDQDPNGSSTLLTLPDESFPGVDAIALMFSWQDVEKSEGVYDFSKVDYAYDYWAKRGKAIQLRLSAVTLMWWANRDPPAGTGAPAYVLQRLAPHEKQTRTLQGVPYVVEDSRNAYYRARLLAFLRAVDKHFSQSRPVTLVDLRGFGVWGEWHSGFQYPDVTDRREALKGIIDLWRQALPNRKLALCYSYDPDGPAELYSGPTDKFYAQHASHYARFLEYSAFDHAISQPNIAYRRDGCGGAVHSNERKFIEEAFRLGRGPMFSEFMDGYEQSKAGGDEWVTWKIEDALSLHPNYINLLGWQGGDALAFMHQRPDLVADGLRRMGYRLVPTRISHPAAVAAGDEFTIEMQWVNRGVGRAPRDFALQWLLLDEHADVVAATAPQSLSTTSWIAGETYDVAVDAALGSLPPGKYRLAIEMTDPGSGKSIALPLEEGANAARYEISGIEFTSP